MSHELTVYIPVFNLFLTESSATILSVLSTTHCGWGRKWFVDFNAGKTQLVSLDQSNNTGVIDVKMDGSGLEENFSFKS